MRKSKFTDEQIVGIFRATDRAPVPAVAKRHKVSEQSIYTLMMATLCCGSAISHEPLP
jgi:putative transposase